MGGSAKYRNVQANPNVAFVVDEVTEPSMDGAHFLEVRGVAETAVGTHDPQGHLAPEVIRIHPRRIVSFNVDPDHPGFAARDVVAADPEHEVA
jgi:pyridoxamine 5'-phosphate oxidase family protein